MADDTRLFIVSTQPARACRYVVSTDKPPRWARLVFDEAGLRAIPSGSRCFAVWYEPRQQPSLLEILWRERLVERGGITGIGREELEAIVALHPREEE